MNRRQEKSFKFPEDEKSFNIYIDVSANNLFLISSFPIYGTV